MSIILHFRGKPNINQVYAQNTTKPLEKIGIFGGNHVLQSSLSQLLFNIHFRALLCDHCSDIFLRSTFNDKSMVSFSINF